MSDDKKQIVPVEDSKAETPEPTEEKQITTPPDPDPETPEETDEKRMTFTEHLGELRIRIIRSGIAIGIAVVVCFICSDPMIKAIKFPLTGMGGQGFLKYVFPEDDPTDGNMAEPGVLKEGEAPIKEAEAQPTSDSGDSPSTKNDEDVRLHFFTPFEPVFLKIKVAGYGGLLITFPFLLWQICAFVFPGLRPVERKAIKVMIFGCSVLSVAGVMTAYFGVLPFVLPYLAFLAGDAFETTLNASATLGIIIKALGGFAIAFQFPMVVLILVHLEVLTPASLKQYRKVAIVGMAVIAAMLTPPDPLTMCVMLTPLVLLYEGSILVSYLVVYRKKRAVKDAE